ncbi:hypothetical protein [Mycobacterium decipiens]|uniref:hypothetical protein n=1 Tax=Mycobacterium decipiens TaxID=1430326 RepID=UPI00105614BA
MVFVFNSGVPGLREYPLNPQTDGVFVVTLRVLPEGVEGAGAAIEELIIRLAATQAAAAASHFGGGM